jgi:hypothetical protein
MFGANRAPILHQDYQYLQMDRIELHLSLVTKEFHRVRAKWFLSQWYVWRKLRTYLVPIQTLSPNGLKWDSTWPTSPSSTIRCVQNDFRASSTLGANRAPILRQRLPLSPNGLNQASTWASSLGVPSGVSKMIFEPLVCSVQTVDLSCVKITTLSKWTEPSLHLSLVT